MVHGRSNSATLCKYGEHMKIAVVYHAGCPDGIYSLKVARYALEACGHEVEAVKGVYGVSPVIPEGAEMIYFVDFSVKRDELQALNENYKVVVLDHHKTAEAELAGLPYAHFDMSESGATMTWKHFFPNSEVPTLLQYARDRDLWLWELPHSQEISAAIMELPKTEAGYPGKDEWGDPGYFKSLLAIGGPLLKFRTEFAKKTATNCHYRTFGPYTVPCTFSPTLESEIGHELLVNHDARYPVAVNFIVNPDGSIRTSMRGRGAVDCGAFLREAYGGGGHPNAAGCTFPNLTQLDLLAPPAAKLPDNM